MSEPGTGWWGSISLRSKITGVTVVLVTLGLLVAGVGTMTVLRNYLVSDVDNKISELATTVTITPTGAANCDPSVDPDKYYFSVLTTDGALVCSSDSTASSRPKVTGLTLSQVNKLDGDTFTVWDEAHSAQWRVVAVPGKNSSGVIFTVIVGSNLDDTNRIIAQYVTIFLGFGISVVFFVFAITRLLVTSTFAPLREVEATAAAIAEGDFSQRLPGATPNTEVGRLNRSLNTMLNRIDRAFSDRARTIDQMRRFVGDASHELRTPLVSVRGYAELYRMGALTKPEDVAQAMERIEKEAIRMGELVSDLLELARIDDAKPLQLAPVDLVPIARDAALDAMASAPDRDVTVEFVEIDSLPDGGSLGLSASSGQTGEQDIEPEQPSTTVTGAIAFSRAQLARLRRRPARGEQALAEPIAPIVATPSSAAIVLAEENKIRQVVTNLMGNAMRFTDVTSPIEIVVCVDPDRRVGMIDIVDHGDGIPPQIRDKIFQRFWRADTSRTRETGGSGLGLAIVSGIVASHKGNVEVFETPGGGATFRVTLPLLPTDWQPPVATDAT